VRRADHVGFSVASLEASLAFWVEGLGAHLVRTGEMGGDFLRQVTGARDAQVRMAILSLAGQSIELLEFNGPDRPAAPSRAGQDRSIRLAAEGNAADDDHRRTRRNAGDLRRRPGWRDHRVHAASLRVG
jgi:catechol 2,3-dioxygenase-like lactoylglutathione lyase family enzyme